MPVEDAKHSHVFGRRRILRTQRDRETTKERATDSAQERAQGVTRLQGRARKQSAEGRQGGRQGAPGCRRSACLLASAARPGASGLHEHIPALPHTRTHLTTACVHRMDTCMVLAIRGLGGCHPRTAQARTRARWPSQSRGRGPAPSHNTSAPTGHTDKAQASAPPPAATTSPPPHLQHRVDAHQLTPARRRSGTHRESAGAHTHTQTTNTNDPAGGVNRTLVSRLTIRGSERIRVRSPLQIRGRRC